MTRGESLAAITERTGMRIQVAGARTPANAQASFLQGGISARRLPSADVTPFVERGRPHIHQAVETVLAAAGERFAEARIDLDAAHLSPDPAADLAGAP
jgi:hypothetical protein